MSEKGSTCGLRSINGGGQIRKETPQIIPVQTETKAVRLKEIPREQV